MDFYELVKSNDRITRRAIADNINCPPEVLRQLAEDEVYKVRASVALNPNTPKEVLIELSKDKFDTVRRNVADNANTPTKVLQALSEDEDKTVREYATRALQERFEDWILK